MVTYFFTLDKPISPSIFLFFCIPNCAILLKEEKGDERVLYGISTACFYPQETEQSVQVLANHQIPCCEIFLNTASELSESYAKKMKQAADDTGMRILSVHPYTCAFEPFMLFTNYPRRFQDGIEYHKRYFDMMNHLNASIFVFHGDRKQGPLDDREYYERFAVLRDLGKTFGITVAQENVERCKSRSVSFLAEMCRYLDGDVRFVFDNKQALRSGVDPVLFIRRFAKQICHVHISDSVPECDCCAIQEGSSYVKKTVDALREANYDGGIIVELYRDLLKSEEEIFLSYKNLKLL